MSFLTDMQQVARELLTEFGQTISVTRQESTFVPATGTVTEPSPVTYSGVGYPSTYNRRDIDNTIIRQDDTLLIFSSSTVPEVNDIFTIGTKVMTALSLQVVTINTGDVVYKIQLRQ